MGTMSIKIQDYLSYLELNFHIGVIKKKFFQSIFYIFFAAFLFSAVFASDIPSICINPEINVVKVGQNFTVEIKVMDINDLYGWEFKLKWNPNLLDFVDVVEGSFLKQKGDTFFAKRINKTEGYVIVDCTLLGNVNGANGNGTLALIEFYAKVQGECILDLCETTLINSSEQPITHSVSDGKVYSEPKIADFISLLMANIQSIIIAIVIIAGVSFIALWFLKFKRKTETKGRVEIIDDEEKIISALKSAGGRLYQSTLADRCGFSRSKISKLLKEMEKKGKVRREEKGRGKIVILIEG